jgi:hypothetical protein
MYGGAGGHNILKGHPKTTPTKKDLILFSRFRRENLNLIFIINQHELKY